MSNIGGEKLWESYIDAQKSVHITNIVLCAKQKKKYVKM